MQVSIIIVSYNVKYFLEQCLYSVEAACKNLNAEIIVVDNASSDGSADYISSDFPRVTFVKNEINHGFSRANNKGMSLASGDHVLFLNPDTIISENSITACLNFLSAHRDAGAVGVRLIDGSGYFLPESKRSFPSPMASFYKLAGISSLFPRSSFFNRYAVGNLHEGEVAEVDVLPGAFFMACRQMLIGLNGFDENFFMYGEDIDLSYRIKKSGYKNYYLGTTVAIHFKGESTQKDDPAYRKNFYTAMKIFVDKHYSKASSVFLKAGISAARIFSPLKRTTQKNHDISSTHFLLVGADDDIQSAEKILSTLHYSFEKIHSLSQLHQTSNIKHQTSNLIFCTGKLSYGETIDFVKGNTNRFTYYWHKAGSKSITGSSSSSTMGKIYHL